MNTEKPDWSAMVKESSVGKGIFSEEMKQTVIIQVEQNQRKKMKNLFFYIVVPLIGLMICLSILPLFDGLPAAFQSVKIADTKAIMGSVAISEDDIILDYEPAKDLPAIPDTDKGVRGWTLLRLPLTSVQIKEVVSFGGIGKYINFTKSEEGSTSYFGFQLTNHFSSTNGEFYEIGYGKISDVKFQKSDAFGFSDLRLDGKCGPERRCVYWISLNQDAVMAYEQNDASTIYEQDLDGDGVSEAIVLTHAQEIYIYKNIDGQIKSVHVQAALKAGYGDTVTYNPDNQVFQLNNENEPKRYRYAAGVDKLRRLLKVVNRLSE